ncbi:hypothetical protein EDD40_7441 [Saccharothrix texasensis]|uniref:Uncharacterized protein n=2 Tax=Saccharothrix texasensis TaxID=103734 RepID=A0A3N1HHI9_9PSEU|nr:hypothetical protein EDD40_7441 [Saccharothrix texasensis]
MVLQAGRDVTVTFASPDRSDTSRSRSRLRIAIAVVGVIAVAAVTASVITYLRGALVHTPAGAQSPTSTNTAVENTSSSWPHSPVRPSKPSRPDTSIGEPQPTMAKKEYRLKPSSDVRTNDIDKIDLDTGCPGWGPTSIPVGRKRCGELADLIVEDYGVHAPNDQPLLTPVDGLATYTSCRDRTDGVGTILLEDLHEGAQLCVWTDKRNIAAVHINSVAETGEVVIDYELWTS